jgi:uncharacterized protein (DUF433 family)
MARQGTSIRIRPDLKGELERRARQAGMPAAALYERFIDEGLRREDHPLIVFRDGAGGRRATLAGSRLTVAQVIDTLIATEGPSEGDRIRDTAEYLAIPAGHVQASIRYYAAYKDEVDAWRQEVAEAAERERDAWQREQALFA